MTREQIEKNGADMTHDDLIEAMARAYGIAHGPWGPTLEAEIVRRNTTWMRYVDEMKTTLSAIEAFGAVVVPRVPTEAMIQAGVNYSSQSTSEVYDAERLDAGVAALFSAMAAQTPYHARPAPPIDDKL